jgi:hypothetical protein
MVTTPLALALDELAGAVASAPHDAGTAASLAEVVLDLERVAAAPLGQADRDPVVALVRRFARAHRLLLAGEARGLDVGTVRAHVVRVAGGEAGAPAGRSDRLVTAA